MPNSNNSNSETSSNVIFDICLDMVEAVAGKSLNDAFSSLRQLYDGLSAEEKLAVKDWYGDETENIAAEASLDSVDLSSPDGIVSFILSIIGDVIEGCEAGLASQLGIAMHDASNIASDGGVASELNIAEVASALMQ